MTEKERRRLLFLREDKEIFGLTYPEEQELKKLESRRKNEICEDLTNDKTNKL